MRVLHVTNYLALGGAEKLLEASLPLMNEMDEAEADVLLLTDDNNVFEESLIGNGVKVDTIKYRNLYDPRNILAIKRHIVAGDYDIVHSHTFPTQYWVAFSRLLLANKKVKFVTTEHNTHNRRRGKSYFKPIEKLVYNQYDAIVSISDKTQECLLEWLKPQNKRNKFTVIENGVDIGAIGQAVPYKKGDLIAGLNEETKLVCMVGRFTEQKDQPTLIRAAKHLPNDVHLVFVGDGPLMSDNKRLANDLGISERVHFLNFRQDIPRILKTVDIVVMSSHWEGFGLAAVEGMAASKPVLASDVDGLREVVEGAGLIFNGEMDLSDSITALLKDDSFYSAVSKKCFVRSEKYDIKNMVGRICELYARLLSEK